MGLVYNFNLLYTDLMTGEWNWLNKTIFYHFLYTPSPLECIFMWISTISKTTRKKEFDRAVIELDLKLWHLEEAHIPSTISKNESVWAFWKKWQTKRLRNPLYPPPLSNFCPFSKSLCKHFSFSFYDALGNMNLILKVLRRGIMGLAIDRIFYKFLLLMVFR